MQFESDYPRMENVVSMGSEPEAGSVADHFRTIAALAVVAGAMLCKQKGWWAARKAEEQALKARDAAMLDPNTPPGEWKRLDKAAKEAFHKRLDLEDPTKPHDPSEGPPPPG